MRRHPTISTLPFALLAAAGLPLAAGPASPSVATTGPSAARTPLPDTVVRLVEGARAAVSEGRHREAARRFRAAAAGSTETARWLRLSALQQASRAGDTALARALADSLRGDAVVPEDSVRVETARAAFEAGDEAGGREAASALDGDEAPDLWVEHAGPAVLAAGDTSRARAGYLAAAAAEGAPAEAGRVLARLGAGWEELAAVARADLREGRSARGREILARALRGAPRRAAPDLAVRLVRAELASGLWAGAHATAKAWLGRDGLDGRTRASLEILAARSHLRRGQRSAGETHLRRGRRAGGGDRSARAAYLLADLAHDRGDRGTARSRYRAAAERFPGARLGGQARMRIGFMDLADGRTGSAAEHFRAYRLRQPRGSWGHAALYWEGRARLATGDSTRGRDLLERAARRDPVSYYGQLAARRLEADPLEELVRRRDGEGRESGSRSDGAAGGPSAGTGIPAAAPTGRPRGSGGAPSAGGRPAGDVVDALLGRMAGLRRLGWEDRALRELDVARDDALDAAGGPLRFANRLHGAGWPDRGIGMAWRAFDRRDGAWSRPLLEAVFPLPHRDAVTAAASRHGIEPALVAAVIRQESAFDAGAISSAGAVGLMQLMPGTAAELARETRRPTPDEAALTNPELSVALGARYLSGLIDRFDGSRSAALIAYNAGPRRYLRWRRFPAFRQDRELLVERIPFGETRRYVKAVMRNVYLYRRLYDLPGAAPREAD